MFCNVNQVIQQLYMAERDGYQFVIDASKSCYFDSSTKQDGWECFFKQPFELSITDFSGLEECPEDLPNVYMHGQYLFSDNIIASFLVPEDGVNFYFWPDDRHLPHRYIHDYLKLDPRISHMVDDFASQHFNGRVIGLHIRGEGGRDAGEVCLRRVYASLHGSEESPYQPYLDAVGRELERDPDAKVFACSDSSIVMAALQKHFGPHLISYAATRSEFGEMHIATHKMNAGQTFSPYQLGMDVLVEAHLLAKTDVFVHGHSNIVNYVLCHQPELPHVYVYRDIVQIPKEMGVLA